jgi:hypothetical protein
MSGYSFFISQHISLCLLVINWIYGLSLFDKLQYTWLCCNFLFWAFTSEHLNTLSVSFLSYEGSEYGILLLNCVTYLTATVINSDLMTRYEQAEHPSTIVPIAICSLIAKVAHHVTLHSHHSQDICWIHFLLICNLYICAWNKTPSGKIKIIHLKETDS